MPGRASKHLFCRWVVVVVVEEVVVEVVVVVGVGVKE